MPLQSKGLWLTMQSWPTSCHWEETKINEKTKNSNDTPKNLLHDTSVSFFSDVEHALQVLGWSFIKGEDKGNSDQCVVNDLSPGFPLVACLDAQVFFEPLDGVVQAVVKCGVGRTLYAVLRTVVDYQDET